MTTDLISHTDIPTVWGEVSESLSRAIEWSDGKYQLRHIFDELCANKMQLWKNGNSCAVTQVVDYPGRRVLIILLCGGENMKDWFKPGYAMIEEYGRRAGATLIEVYGRPGWERALIPMGYEKSLVLVRKSL